MARVKIADLLPGTDYVVQVRAVRDGENSKWSEKFNFTSIENSVLPKTPTNVSWFAQGTAFHGQWDKVNQQLDNDFAKVIRYDVELENSSGTLREVIAHPASDEPVQKFKLGEQKMTALFGQILSTVKMRVRAVTQNENKSAWSTPITATFAAPEPPTSAVVEEGVNFVKLSWTAPADMTGVDGYRVYSGTTAGFTPSLANRIYQGVAPTATYNSKVYTKRYFKIRSYSRYNVESTDLTAEGTPQNPSDPAIPVAPTGVTWVAVGDAFHGEWNQVTTGTLGETGVKIDRYELEMTGNPGAVIAMAAAPEVASGKPFFTLSYEENVARFIAAKANITMRVRAVTTFGVVGAWSTMTSAAINNPPSAPTGLAGTVNFEYIDLKWNAVSDADLVGYRLYLSTTGAAGTYNQIYQGQSLNYSFPSAMYTTDHHFQVKAYDAFGLESAASNTVGPLRPKSSFVVDVTAPGVPTALAASAANYPNGIGAYALVSWTAPADTDLAGYTVRYRKNGTSDNWISQTVDKTTVSVMVDLPQANTQYEFQVRAFDWSANHGAYTASVVSALPSNPVPANVTTPTSTGGVDAVTFTWTPVADTDLKDYEVTFSTSATFASGNTTFYAGTNSLTVSGLSSGTTYYARVRARDHALQTSAAWSGTKSQATSAFPTPPDPTDNAVPSSSPAATLSQGIGTLFVAWPAIVNNDPVTYEVHLSTTAGFNPTPGGATKVAETAGTVVTLNRDASGAALSYTSTYYARIIAKDADGPATTAGTVSAGVSPKKAGTGDIISIVADQIATSSLSTSVLSISNTGAIQSNVFNATTGFKISASGIEINDANSKIKAPALEGGTISASVAFTLGPNANFIVNGGHMRSNTYTYPGQTGSTYAFSTAATAGWYLGNDGLVIVNGAVKANALISDTLTLTTITLGNGGKIIGGTWELNSSGLVIPNGGIEAGHLNLSNPTLANNVGATMTTIDGGIIKTGSIQSQTNTTINGASVPLWSIPTNGSATFANLTVRGITVVGTAGDAGALNRSTIQSANYDGVNGWKIDANGHAYFASGTFKGDISAATGTFNGSITGSAATVTGTITGNTVQTSSASTYVTRMTSTSFKIIGSDAANPLLDFSTGSNTMTIGANAVFKGTLNGVTGTFGTSVSVGPASDQIVFRNSGTAGIIDFYDGGGVSSSMYGYTSGLWITNDVTVVGTLRPYQLVMQSGGIVETNYLESTTSLLIVRDAIQFNFATTHNGSSNDFYGAIHMNNNNINSVAQLTASTIAGDPVFSHMVTGTGGTQYAVVGNAGRISKQANAPSDERLKENLHSLDEDNFASMVLQVEPFEFSWKGYGNPDVGFMANRIGDLGPEMDRFIGRDDEGRGIGVNYPMWVVAQQSVLRHHNKRIQELENRIKELENL